MLFQVYVMGVLLALREKQLQWCSADCVGTDAVGGCGMLYSSVTLPQPLKHATLSYSFSFDAAYDWKRGGKLPGMCDHGAQLSC